MEILKTDNPYLSKQQWVKLFVAFSVLTILLYIGAMIASLCGSTYFILNYQNDQMENIETFLRSYKIMPLLNYVFSTIEYCIVLGFVLKKFPKWYYILPFYAIRVGLAFVTTMPSIFNTAYPLLFYIVIPIIEIAVECHNAEIKRKFDWKKYGFCMLRILIAMGIVLALQLMIYVIKSGNFSMENHIMNLSATFVYALEYDIALAVILFTILLLYREKGDSKVWMNYQQAGSSSQTSNTKSQKSKQKKNLTKTQKNKIFWLYFRFYLTQIGAFLLLMVLPFLLGKVLEFLVMYLSFAVARFLLGFKYSLHFKKETICITVGVIVFGILSLAVPFFYVVLIMAVALGIGLAILLHLSYKYKGMWLFTSISKPDKFAVLYTYFDGNLEHEYVRSMCIHKNLDKEQTQLILDYTQGMKISYLAWKHNYSIRMINYKLDEAIDLLIH